MTNEQRPEQRFPPNEQLKMPKDEAELRQMLEEAEERGIVRGAIAALLHTIETSSDAFAPVIGYAEIHSQTGEVSPDVLRRFWHLVRSRFFEWRVGTQGMIREVGLQRYFLRKDDSGLERLEKRSDAPDKSS